MGEPLVSAGWCSLGYDKCRCRMRGGGVAVCSAWVDAPAQAPLIGENGLPVEMRPLWTVTDTKNLPMDAALEMDHAVQAGVLAEETPVEDFVKAILADTPAPSKPLPEDVAKGLADAAVVLPPHYNRFPIEPIRFAVLNRLDMLEANTVKYTVRAPYKHADKGLQDYCKATRSIIMKAKQMQGDPDWWKPYRNENLAALIEEEITGGPRE